MTTENTARHAGATEAWIKAPSMVRRRLAKGMRAAGRHGIAHEGLHTTRVEDTLTRFLRTLTRKPKNGRHGIPATHPIGMRLQALAAANRVAVA